ncbi:spore protease YyaC [Priestia megaterium]|uniref:spore protease YyaC n=1 Tax=Priestia megaterium TaxID=1404 RepID=UPI003F7FECE6
MRSFYNRKEGKDREIKLHCVTGTRIEERELEKITLKMKEIIENSLCEGKNIVFLCIGSDRYVGDSLGPLVGTMLEENQVPYHIYGTLESPVHAFNLKTILKEINRKYKNPLIFSIDACLGEQSQVGLVIFKEGPLIPGKAVEKVLPKVGDYHIKGMVNYIDPLPTSQFLNDTRLYTVMNLAKTIVNIVIESSPDLLVNKTND